MTEPYLFDSRGQVTIGSPRTVEQVSLCAQGATSIMFDGADNFAGVYVDNEVPARDNVAKTLVANLPGKRVVVGLYPSEPSHRIPGCVCAYEWYPFHEGWGMPTRTNMGIGLRQRAPQAWILQWNFAWSLLGTPGLPAVIPPDVPPTPDERLRLLRWVRRHHPLARLIWLY